MKPLEGVEYGASTFLKRESGHRLLVQGVERLDGGQVLECHGIARANGVEPALGECLDLISVHDWYCARVTSRWPAEHPSLEGAAREQCARCANARYPALISGLRCALHSVTCSISMPIA